MEKEGQRLVGVRGQQQRNSDLQGPMLALSSHYCHPGERCTGPALTFIQVSPPGEEGETGEMASRCMGLKQEGSERLPIGEEHGSPTPCPLIFYYNKVQLPGTSR